MATYLASLIFVVLAEMGDKTQLLAMAFASRYKWQIVMWGVFFATLINHLMAVLTGNYMTMIFPITYIKVITSASFIAFGFWTLKWDRISDDDKKFNFSPFWTVAIAFFIAEMGDKTQLATIALAAKYNNNILGIWFGTTTGMLVADAIGIIFGIVLGKKIPDKAIKWVSAVIFIIFGILGIYDGLKK
ncbi:MAG: TMEM165/GDT1 family protein [Syntrophorhabdaceae bacterium]|nr:TMEM165/GDT1 family protein [Syntrophorhabdaceae bacterium]